MRKYSLLVLAVALLFALQMAAQTGSSSSSGNSMGQEPGASSSPGSPASQQPGASSGAQSSTPDMSSQSQSGTYGSAQSSTSSTSENKSQEKQEKMGKSGKEKTVEGCIVRQQTDFFIFPKKGQAMRVSGQDLSAHVGHHVKLHGTEENAGMGASASSNTGGTSGAMAGNTGTSTSGAMSENLPAASGSVGGNTSSASAGNMGASSSGSANSKVSNKELVVDRVDMVSETCPANIQNNINKSGMSTGSSSGPGQ